MPVLSHKIKINTIDLFSNHYQNVKLNHNFQFPSTFVIYKPQIIDHNRF